MYAFLSYSNKDKEIAARVKFLLDGLGIQSFMAHEDIAVSEEWRIHILEEIGKADLFFALLSANYEASIWCQQEAGIAAFRKTIALIPLSLDDTVPKGFLSHVQAARIDPKNLQDTDLLPAIAKRDISFVINVMVERVRISGSFRGAEANFRLILPYLEYASDDQIKRLLEVSARNGQVHHAAGCARIYLPPLLESHGQLLDEKTRSSLKEVCAQYADRE
jgi:hypothetical protein